MEQIRLVGRVVLSRLLGFVIFMILLFAANMLIPYIGNSTYNSVVYFINDNAYVIVVFTVLVLISELFSVLAFPFNLPAPLFNAIGGLFLVKFVFDLIIFVDSTIKMPANLPYEIFRNLAYVLVFLFVIVIGYVKILIEAGKKVKTIVSEKGNEKSQKIQTRKR